jgi:hypothetical protein
LRLIDIALAASCAPATVRAYEFSAPVRPAIQARLEAAYDCLCAAQSTAATTAGEVQQ